MSIYEYAPGKFQIRIFLGKDQDGKQIFHRDTFEGTEKEALIEEGRLKAIYSKRRGGISKITVAEFMDKWIANYVTLNLRKSTQPDYITISEKRIKPILGSIKLVKLMPADIQRLLKITSEKRLDGKDKPVSQKTIKNTHTVVRSALEYARRSGYIDINPAAAVRSPKVPKYIPHPLTVEEVFKFLDLAKKKSKYYLFYLTSITTGFRRGEVLALEWRNINFDAGRILVENALVEGKIGPAKSDLSNRTTGLANIVLDEMIEAKRKSKSDYIFVTKNGSFYDPASIIKRDFKPLLRELGISELTRLHDLRHTLASLLLDSGVDLKHISEQLGHSSIKITMDLYTHILNRDSTTQKINEIFSEKTSKNLSKTLEK